MGTYEMAPIRGCRPTFNQEPVGSDKNHQTQYDTEDQTEDLRVEAEYSPQQFLVIWRFFSQYFNAPFRNDLKNL